MPFNDPKQRNRIVLAAVLTMAAALRFWHLDFQSLWLDELYTMKECDPSLSWSEMFGLVQEHECKSPFYYILVRLACTLFGYTSWVLRAVSVFGGVAGVYAVYLLVKEMSNIRVAQIAALMTAVNPFHIWYSQEGRGYIFLFLFAALSWLFFTRCLRGSRMTNAVWYGLSTVLAMHIHPFAALVPFSQLVVLGFCFFDKQQPIVRQGLWRRCGFSLLILVIGCLPLLRDFRSASGITDFWVQKPEQTYFIDFFYEFFGNSGFLKPLLWLLMIAFLVPALRSRQYDEGHPGLVYNFAVVFVTLTITFLLPYLYSILKVPATVSRYFISVLPLLIATLALGAGRMESILVRGPLVSVFVLIAVTDLFVIQKYYSQPNKTQFREMLEYVSYYSDKPHPINNERTAWHSSYYLKKLEINSHVTGQDKGLFIDSVMKAKADRPFWLIGAHLDPKVTEEKLRLLQTRYVLTKSENFYDAWAMLFRPINEGTQIVRRITYHEFETKYVEYILGDSVVALWDNAPRLSKAIRLPVGNYVLRIENSGTPAAGIYPHLLVYKNEVLIGDLSTQEVYGFSRPINIDVMPGEEPFVLRIAMDNDENHGAGQDRNAFVRSVTFYKD